MENKTGAKFLVKCDVEPEQLAGHLNTQHGLGYDAETFIPNDDHTRFILIFRRRESNGMPPGFEELLAQSAGAAQGLGGDLDVSDLLGDGDLDLGGILDEKPSNL